MDGNWAAAIVTGGISLLGFAVGYGAIRARLARLEESVGRRVSKEAFEANKETYEQRQVTQEEDIKEIKADVHENRESLHRMEGKLDLLIEHEKQHHEGRA